MIIIMLAATMTVAMLIATAFALREETQRRQFETVRPWFGPNERQRRR